MPRPCQRRRESAAAQRKSKPNNPKPSGPPPIRHKAKQKAIHNARQAARGGGARGRGRGGGRGGRASRNQGSGNAVESNQDFISFASNGNNYHVLNRAGSRNDPIELDEDDSLDDGEITDSDSQDDDSGHSEDSEMEDANAMTINVEVNQGPRGRPQRATVMFPMMQALSIYRGLCQIGFPLVRSTSGRFGLETSESMLFVEDLQPTAALGLAQDSRVAAISETVVARKPAASSSSSYVFPASASTSRQPSTSTATSIAAAPKAPAAYNPARDYIFDWGAHSGNHFSEVPENYLRTIAGNPGLLDKHPGIKEALDYHRPGMRRTAPTERQLARAAGEPVQAASRGRNQGSRGGAKAAKKPWTTFTFPSGAHANKKLNEVPENYLRTIEGMAHVVNKWVGLKDALLDYNAKTGRQRKIAS
jgi:hypothetical protein